MDWLKNLNQTIEYIENNLEGEISLDKCAQISCCSTFYFQRIFSYITGVSISEYIKKRRMTQAGFELKRTDKKIIDIALKYGYSSPNSFTRAFKSVHKLTPSEARKVGSTIKSYPKIELSIDISGDKPLNYHIKELDKLKFLGTSIRLANNIKDNQKIIPFFWQKTLRSKIFKDILALESKPKNIFGITEFISSKEIYYHISILSNKAIPNNLNRCIVPKSSWAIFENEGDFKNDVQNTFKNLYKNWLPFSDYKYRFLPNIEIYPINEDLNPYGHSKVLISIEKEN